MEKTRKEEEEEEEQAMEGLPNDLLREILSRVPYRSLCRLKCVSPAWLALCSDPAVRRRSPQTLSGFFGDSPSGTTRFLNLSGRGWPLVDPSLPFLRGFENVMLLGCCGGILLCHGTRAWRAEYIVCNPATQEIWAALPVPRRHGPPPEPHIRGRTISLCFDPVAVPSRFAVFVIIDGGHGITAMEVYSSDDAAGEWTSVSSRWGHQMRIGSPSRRMCWDPWTSCESGYFFLDGTLHFIAYDSGEDTINLIVTVDMDGSTWRTIRQPPKVKLTFIGHSQGRLHGTEMDRDNGCRLSVWVLENYAGGGQWTLKHTASILELLGRPCLSPHFTLVAPRFTLVAIHPEHDLIFLDAWVESRQALMSYDMGTQKLQVICSLENYPMQNLRPHVPCFVEWPPSDAH